MTAEQSPFDVARDVAARAHLVSGTISGRASGREGEFHYARLSPGAVRLRSGWRHSFSNPSAIDARRGKITEFSDRSRRGLKSRARETEWPRCLLVFATLTWPGTFPLDPDEWSAKLRAYRKAVSRRYGMPTMLGRRSRRNWKPGSTSATGLWAREFQKRGAPHYHLALALPRGTELEEFRRWSALTWYRLIGAGDGDAECAHRDDCVGRCWWSVKTSDGRRICGHNGRCDGRDCRAYAQHLKPGHCKKARTPYELLGYLAKEIAKRRQKELPAWIVERDQGAGRWWGIWNLPRVFIDEPMTRSEFHALRRVGRRLAWSQDRARAVSKIRDAAQLQTVAHRGGAPVTRWKPRSWMLQGFSNEDRSGRQWTLAQAMYGFMRYLRGASPPRSSYERWDQLVDRRLPLFDDDVG